MSCGCLKLFGIVVALIGVLLALAPIGSWVDNWLDEDGSYRTKGLFPFTHHGVPFGFQVEELPDLTVAFAHIT